MSRTQNRFGDRLLMALVFLFLYAPIIILIVFSFNAGTSSSVWKGFSLKWYESLLSNRLIMNSVYTTLLVSLLSTIVASIAGTFAAIGLYAMSRRRRAAVNAVNNIPMMNADIVTGVSPTSQVPLGSELVKIQGEDPGSYLEKQIAPLVAARTFRLKQNRMLERFVYNRQGESLQLTWKLPDGEEKITKPTNKKSRCF